MGQHFTPVHLQLCCVELQALSDLGRATTWVGASASATVAVTVGAAGTAAAASGDGITPTAVHV